VDDGSADQSWRQIEMLVERDPRVRGIRFRKNCGETAASDAGLHRFIPTLLKLEGFTVTEISVTNNPRLYGQSKYGVWNRLFKSFRDQLAIRWMTSRTLGYEIATQLDRTRELSEVGP
jgi:hypothetical protein